MEFKVTFNQNDINRFLERFGEEKATAMYQVTKDYAQKLIRSSKSILSDTKGNGELENSLYEEINVSGNRISMSINAATPHARFVHEGAKHEGSQKIVSHFVPFKTAPDLWLWLKRNKFVYQKKLKAKKEKRWYAKSRNTGKEYLVNPNGGMVVKNEPLKYFEIPFYELKDKYVEDMRKIIAE